MAKIPDKPQDIFVPVMQDYLKVFGKDLVSLMIYGSAAGGSYVKGKSDINLLIVLTEDGINRLEDAFEVVHSWKKRSLAIPLVMTKAFIESSLDSYPIEFLNMKNHHVLIFGENILDKLNFKPEDLRLQIERELKGKILLLRGGYLETEGSARKVKQLIRNSLTAFISIFNAILYLKRGVVPKEKQGTIKEMGDVLAIDTDVFIQCFQIKEGTDHLASTEVGSVFKRYLHEVEKVCHIIDAL